MFLLSLSGFLGESSDRREKVYTKGVFRSENSSAQQAKKGLVYTKNLVFKEKSLQGVCWGPLRAVVVYRFGLLIIGCQASQRKGLTSREVWGTSGEVWEASWEPLKRSSQHPQ